MSIDLYQVDIPPIQPETWKFVVRSWPLPGVWSACPWPASAADFEGVRGGHGAFRAQAARLRRVPEDDLRGVVRQDPPGIRADAGFPRGATPHCVVPCSVLPGVPSPPEMPWWRRCGPAPSSTPMRRAGFAGRSSGLAVGLHEPARDRLRDPSGPWFRAGRLGAWGKTTRAPSG